MKGLVAFSFGLSPVEPNPCNRRLGKEALRLFNEEGGQRGIILALQWEVSWAVNGLADLTIQTPRAGKGAYLGSEEVMEQAAEFFRRLGVTEVIIVAHPFLHLTKCKRLARDAGFTVLERPISRRIGFDRRSLQWWARDPARLLLYAVLQRIFGFRGKEVRRLHP